MARVRISTTVDQTLLDEARNSGVALNDAGLIDSALKALLARERASQIDESYGKAYAAHPIDDPDEWGDLESFHEAASK